MSAPTTTAESTRPRPLAESRFVRIAAVAIAALGPLLMAVHLFAIPSGPADDIPTSIVAILADPAAAQLALLFIALSAVFGSAGTVIATAAIRGGSPRFALVAGSLAFLGWGIAGYPGPIAAVAAARAAGLDDDQVRDLVAQIDANLPAPIVGPLFVLLPAGVLLLGVAALIASRSRVERRYPVWAAVLMVSAIPVVIVCGLLPGKLLAVSWFVVSAAYAVAGWFWGHPVPHRSAEARP